MCVDKIQNLKYRFLHPKNNKHNLFCFFNDVKTGKRNMPKIQIKE
jgi:hypothetical protein